jgi:hypothetical protein
MNLYKASSQWSTRPSDERFSNLYDLHTAVSGYRDSAMVAPVVVSDLRVEAQSGELALIGRQNVPATLTNFAFGQIAQTVKAPAGYLRGLPPTLAAQNINHGLSRASDDEVQLLLHKNGGMVLRGMNSPGYTRIWNSDITKRLLELPGGWRVPPARPAFADQPGTRLATEADVLAAEGFELSVKVGDPIAPAGLYASDHDMFAFLINESRVIAEPGNPSGLARGFFVWNQEVPGVSFGVMTFYYRNVCGNHIVWGAENVHEIRIRHVGQADERAFNELSVELVKYADRSASEDEARITRARAHSLGATKDEVLDAVLGLKIAGLTRTLLTEAYELTEENVDTDGSPRTAWGLAQGLTRISQKTPFADERVKLDRAAGKVIEIAF